MTDTRPIHARAAIVDRLCVLFRTRGYEGVSIGDVSEATGLGRSSLYHHFPGGKEEMAESVIATARDAIGRTVIAALAGPGQLGAKVDAMLAGARELYADGEIPCVLASFVASSEDGTLARRAADALACWVEALTATLRDAGFDACEARARANAAIGQIQGALVMSRVLRSRDMFETALDTARTILLGSP